jgi:hypothetical protein
VHQATPLDKSDHVPRSVGAGGVTPREATGEAGSLDVGCSDAGTIENRIRSATSTTPQVMECTPDALLDLQPEFVVMAGLVASGSDRIALSR